ncbi:MAG: ABC transporter ATP-binding protein [Chitinophagaceae bacterium]
MTYNRFNFLPNMLAIQDLNKKYSKAIVPSIDHLSFSISKGKIFGLLGPNGAGKTTTISIISGLIEQYTGEVKVMGYDLAKNKKDILSLIGIVPQQFALFPTLTCYENLIYFGKLYQLEQTALKQSIDHYLSIFGLQEHQNKLIKHYSGGMMRRANIIASLLHNPQLLILDEPTAGVDVHSRNMIIDFLLSYNKAGHSIIYTSHLLEEAERICDEVLIIDLGKKIIQGNPKEICTMHACENLQQLFLKLTGNSLRDH